MNAALIKHLAQVRQLYGPNLGTLTDNLPSMGESLHDACNALADDCTLARTDELVSQLKTAEQSLTRLRLAMLERRTEGHGTG
jgi:hypothetical protein